MEYKRQPIGLSKAIQISSRIYAFVIKQEYKYILSQILLMGPLKKLFQLKVCKPTDAIRFTWSARAEIFLKYNSDQRKEPNEAKLPSWK